MDYCGPRGIPYTVFLSWSEFDQEAALAWQQRQATRCPSCGTYEDEWRSEDGQPIPKPWVASAHLCLGCQQLDGKRRDPAIQQAPDGMSVRLVRPPH
jgi:hypothetical protein